MKKMRGYARDERIREYIVPFRIMKTWGQVTGEECLLEQRAPQIPLGGPAGCILENEAEIEAGVLLDFGSEFHGSARIYVKTADSKAAPGRANLRIRFGESVSEALTPLGENNATNDHANRDFILNAGSHSAMETNETGYRFVYVGLADPCARVDLYMVQGVMIGRDLPEMGYFRCNDERINAIFHTAAYTVYLNMQEYLWDGIKRDRLVWCGDIYPAEQTILALWGGHEILKKSLDLQREVTLPSEWMNGLPSYSLWWLISHELFYRAAGDRDYLLSQHGYMRALVRHIAGFIGENGEEKLPGLFLDWPTSENPAAIHAGQQALMVMAFDKTAWMMAEMGDQETEAFCQRQVQRLKRIVPSPNGSKQAAALLALSGLANAKEMNTRVIAPGGGYGYSTFLGFAILAAKGEAGDTEGALADMRQYWGAMLDLGATTFWEDFHLDWMKNAGRIDELPCPGKRDVHGERGGYCYEKLRHSLCHAWASGPAPFLMQYVLGVKFLSPGGERILLQPSLGDLAWAEGDYPTPKGLLHVRLDRKGREMQVCFQAPDGVEVTLASREGNASFAK
ncbi:MAG: alpha-L-rhamnosidase [Clostridiales bacterium]|nr:alpha-L-rhamnosidase [Clostridiales bacterium]